MGYASAPFRCEVHRDPLAVRVAVFGELDLASAPVLAGTFEECSKADVREVTVDLRGLIFVDSSGLRCLLDALRRTRERGCVLEFIAGPPVVQRVFELAGVTHVMTFREDGASVDR